jgi:hypothetical protein
MNKRRTVVLAGVALVLLLAGVYLLGPSKVPAGQEPLLALSNANFSAFENAFDGTTDASRLVLFLSPT